jgi:hypothetical protein
MAALTTQKIVETGLDAAFVSANIGGDTAEPGDRVFIVVKNESGGSITVTLAAYPNATSYGAVIPDNEVTVPSTKERWIGPLRGSAYTNPSTGRVDISYSAVSSVTVGAFRV